MILTEMFQIGTGEFTPFKIIALNQWHRSTQHKIFYTSMGSRDDFYHHDQPRGFFMPGIWQKVYRLTAAPKALYGVVSSKKSGQWQIKPTTTVWRTELCSCDAFTGPQVTLIQYVICFLAHLFSQVLHCHCFSKDASHDTAQSQHFNS